MDLKDVISRVEMAERLGIEMRASAKWQPEGKFPATKERRAGRDGKRATVEARSYNEAVQLWSPCPSQGGEYRPTPEAPTFREFLGGYLPLIAANVP